LAIKLTSRMYYIVAQKQLSWWGISHKFTHEMLSHDPSQLVCVRQLITFFMKNVQILIFRVIVHLLYVIIAPDGDRVVPLPPPDGPAVACLSHTC